MKDLLGKSDIPVFFVSGYGGGETIPQAFESGASDFILKPFSPPSWLPGSGPPCPRRTDEPAEPDGLGDLTIDYAQRRVALAGSTLNLTPPSSPGDFPSPVTVTSVPASLGKSPIYHQKKRGISP